MMKLFVPDSCIEKYFDEISSIPRLSGHEKSISAYIISAAKRFGLKYRTDKLYNVVVWKDASPGYEDHDPVMLQAHTDMVGVAAPGITHDFTKDPLRLYEDDTGNIRAKDTTLGADDGYGVAYLLAAMEEDFPHPPLELVFTSQEENGCYGARALDFSDIRSNRMIGLDVMESDIENVCCVGCYSSDRFIIGKHFGSLGSEGLTGITLDLSGVQPVRTGALVHPEQGNAIKIMARLLDRALRNDVKVCISSITGGEAENYNPCDCTISLFTDDPDKLQCIISEELDTILEELDDGSQNISLAFSPCSKEQICSEKDSKDIIDLLYLLPSQTFEISPMDQSMISTNNIGIISLDKGDLEITGINRAKNSGCKDGLNRRMDTLCRLLGFSYYTETRYEPWEYMKDSRLKEITAGLMKDFYGQEMQENICPGGLEICDFLPKRPSLDCVMFAPIGNECHSINEWMNRTSFNRVYDFLKQLLRQL